MIKHYLTYAGKNSNDFNVWISGSGTYDAPERDVTMISVAGRNGDLTVDNGRFKNIEMTYPAFITKDFKRSMAGFRQYMKSLTGYQRLEDTYHPEYYYEAILSDSFDPDIIARNLAGEFEIRFNRKPQRWLKEGNRQVTFTSDGTIFNPTLYESLPLIMVQGTGIFQINGVTVQILENTTVTYIDSDVQNCYYGLNNLNDNVVLVNNKFPTLQSGENGIDLRSGITALTIWPRWWEL